MCNFNQALDLKKGEAKAIFEAATKEKVIYNKVLLCSLYMDYPCCYRVFIINVCA